MLRFMIVFIVLVGFLSQLIAKDVGAGLGCVGIEKLNSSVTPVEMTMSVMECIKSDKYIEGVEMYILMGAYGQFDIGRVVDKSAHQAIPALKTYISYEITETKKEKWFEAVNMVLEDKNIDKICSKIKRIGMPVYYPEYMIAHGLQGFVGGSKGGIYSDFPAKDVWESIIKGYVHCK